MTELLPCPFCGGEADLIDLSDEYEGEYWIAHQCPNGTSAETNSYETEAKAEAAWNTRAERTCHIVEIGEQMDDTLVSDYEFSCGHTIAWAHTYEPNYCPNCGAHVIKSDQYL